MFFLPVKRKIALSEPLYPPNVTESKFPYQIRMIGYKKSSSAIYAHF